MRIRAARVLLAFALAAAMAVAGVAGSAAGAGFVSRPSAGVAGAPVHLLAAGLPGLHGHHAHDHATPVDVLLAPATLLVSLLVVGLAVRRRRTPLRLATSPAHARGPPAVR